MKIYRFLPAAVVGAGITLIAAFFLQPVILVVDGEPRLLRTIALTSAGVLRAAGLPLAAEDRLDPPANAWIPPDGLVRLERARTVWLWVDGAQAGFSTPERIPANWLDRAGLRLYPGDQVLVSGRLVDPLRAQSGSGPYTVQVRQALAIQVTVDGLSQNLYTTASTLGTALWGAGIGPAPEDRISLPLSTPIRSKLAVEIIKARSLLVSVGQQQIRLRSAAPTVGQALAENGLSPQGLDRAIPAEDSPLPADGKIRLVRVSETVALAEKLLPFKSQSTLSADLALDERKVVQVGQYGVVIQRERLRLEDGVEAGRTKEGEWTAAEPKDQIIARGTRAVPYMLDTPDGPVEYYRAATVYATSYSPCQQGYEKCSLSTSSGTPLKKGVVAVTLTWYRLLAGSRVYIPGYGIGLVADVGGGIPGRYWIDLGYSEEDYQQWSQNVTVYFLTPIPANVPVVLP